MTNPIAIVLLVLIAAVVAADLHFAAGYTVLLLKKLISLSNSLALWR